MNIFKFQFVKIEKKIKNQKIICYVYVLLISFISIE